MRPGDETGGHARGERTGGRHHGHAATDVAGIGYIHQAGIGQELACAAGGRAITGNDQPAGLHELSQHRPDGRAKVRHARGAPVLLLDQEEDLFAQELAGQCDRVLAGGGRGGEIAEHLAQGIEGVKILAIRAIVAMAIEDEHLHSRIAGMRRPVE